MRFGEGRWNGFGGKLAPGETVEEAARRELVEECGIVPTVMEHLGVLDFHYLGKDKQMEVNIFRVTQFTGKPQESEEMLPQWFDVTSLPYTSMWPDDIHWMPLFLQGKKFTGTFLFQGYDAIIKHNLKVLYEN